jgi:hypothetical protein
MTEQSKQKIQELALNKEALADLSERETHAARGGLIAKDVKCSAFGDVCDPNDGSDAVTQNRFQCVDPG